jgi:hypothetical protein
MRGHTTHGSALNRYVTIVCGLAVAIIAWLANSAVRHGLHPAIVPVVALAVVGVVC